MNVPLIREMKKAFSEIKEDVMNASAKFWDQVAAGYARRPIADEAAYQKKLQVTREYFQPSMNVLEFGCGTGSTAIAHAPLVKVFTIKDLEKSLIDAGFAIDYQWQPGDYKLPIGQAKIVFIVAKKAE